MSDKRKHPDVERFRGRLKKALAGAEKDQKEVAADLGITDGQISRWKKAGGPVPQSDQIVRLPGILGCDAWWLLTGEGEMRPTSVDEGIAKLAAIRRILDDPATGEASASELEKGTPPGEDNGGNQIPGTGGGRKTS